MNIKRCAIVLEEISAFTYIGTPEDRAWLDKNKIYWSWFYFPAVLCYFLGVMYFFIPVFMVALLHGENTKTTAWSRFVNWLTIFVCFFVILLFFSLPATVGILYLLWPESTGSTTQGFFALFMLCFFTFGFGALWFLGAVCQQNYPFYLNGVR